MPYLNMIPFASGNTLETMTKDATATSDKILDNETAYVNGEKITGNMPNQGSKSSSLNCGESYNIPEGYHDGTGVISANSLASQTSATATASDILSGETAWVNGVKLTGTADQGYKIVSGTFSYSSSRSSINITVSDLSSVVGLVIHMIDDNDVTGSSYIYVGANTITNQATYVYSSSSGTGRTYFQLDNRITCKITGSNVSIYGSQYFYGDYIYFAWGN